MKRFLNFRNILAIKLNKIILMVAILVGMTGGFVLSQYLTSHPTKANAWITTGVNEDTNTTGAGSTGGDNASITVNPTPQIVSPSPEPISETPSPTPTSTQAPTPTSTPCGG